MVREEDAFIEDLSDAELAHEISRRERELDWLREEVQARQKQRWRSFRDFHVMCGKSTDEANQIVLREMGGPVSA